MRFAPLLALLLLAACASQPKPPAPVAKAPPAPPAGMERLIGKPVEVATTLLGQPTLDRRDGPARMVQWSRAGQCVLDLFYYPRGGTSVATFAAARRADGGAITAAQCLGLLSAR